LQRSIHTVHFDIPGVQDPIQGRADWSLSFGHVLTGTIINRAAYSRTDTVIDLWNKGNATMPLSFHAAAAIYLLMLRADHLQRLCQSPAPTMSSADGKSSSLAMWWTSTELPTSGFSQSFS
jgi:hypothetical protein